jgi:hypothetical protein
MLINVPLEFKVINGYNRICGCVYHNFNNQRCRVKLITYFFQWTTVNPDVLRIDSTELCPVGLPTPLYGYTGNGIMLMQHIASQYTPHSSYDGYEVDIVGDEIHFDIVPASMPAGVLEPYPFPISLKLGQLMLDITPI